MKVPLRIVIADDGALARQRIEDLLATVPEVQILASVGSGTEAIEAIRNLSPDLVFLDIQMPDKSGIDVLRDIGPDHMPISIFVTAYDSYALRAFELSAIDYLLKPFEDERFFQALQRARHQHELKTMNQLAEPLRKLLDNFEHNASEPNHGNYPERFAVETPGQVRVIPVMAIDYILASGHYVEIHAGGKAHVIRERMDHLETKLDPAKFFRIHRSTIVQLDRVVSLLREGGGDYAVRLKSNVELPVSRSRVEALERWMGLTPNT
jgi:two-component system, LytTR family, response regulator